MSKRKRNLIIIFSIIGVFIVLMIVFGVLFSVRKINVDFATDVNRVEAYSEDDIISESGIKKGSNIVFSNYSKAEAKLEKEFPYARFEIVRTFPNRVTIYVYERTPVIRVLSEDGMWHIYDENLKCLEIVSPILIEENGNNLIPVYHGKNLTLATSEGEFIDNAEFSSKLTTIVDGVYGAGETPITVMSDITLGYDDILGLEILTMKLQGTGTTIVIQGSSYQKEKIAYAVYVYLSDVSSNPAYAGKLENITIEVFDSFNPDDVGNSIRVVENQ